MQESLNRARQLMAEKHYAEARQIIAALEHPKRDEWLAKIAAMEHGNRPSPTVITSSEAPPQIKLKKALPLLPEEERALLGGEKPVDPRIIMKHYTRMRRFREVREYMFNLILGVKAVSLSSNFFRMNHKALGICFFLLYIAWLIAAFVAVMIAMTLIAQYNETKMFPLPGVFLGALGFALTLPFVPSVIAWLQQPLYDQWVRDYEQLRTDYFEGKLPPRRQRGGSL